MLYLEGTLLIDTLRTLTWLTVEGKAARLFVFNGVAYFSNLSNFLVLEKVDAVSHGMINCIRRVANIAFGIAVFGNPVNFYNGTGMVLALFGVCCNMNAKQAASSPSPRVARPHQA